MTLPSRQEIENARRIVYEAMPATPQYRWPLLSERAGCEVWLKPRITGRWGPSRCAARWCISADCGKRAARAGGGDGHAREFRAGGGVRGAARGRGGGGLRAARQLASKNRAMRGLGARLVEHGQDFEEARQEARRWAEAEGHHYVPSFHEWLVEGTATYSWELFRAVEGIDVGVCTDRHGVGDAGDVRGARSAGGEDGNCWRGVGARAGVLRIVCAAGGGGVAGGGRGWPMGWRCRLPMRARWN